MSAAAPRGEDLGKPLPLVFSEVEAAEGDAGAAAPGDQASRGRSSGGRRRRPKVLHVISHLDLGGAEVVAVTLAEQLAADHDLHFFAVLGQKDSDVGRDFACRLQTCGIPVHSGTALPFKRGGLLQAAWQLRALLEQLQPDVVHLHTEVPEATYALAAALPGGRRRHATPWSVLRTVHNSTLWPAWASIGRMVERRLTGASVVGVSQACLEGLRRFQRSQDLPPTPESHCRVIYNGVWQENAVTLQTGGPPSAAQADPGRPVKVLFAGRFERQKGADLVPHIAEAAALRLPGAAVELTLLGSGTLEPELRRWVAAHPTSWRVQLGPPLARLAEQLQQFDVLLVPSRFEGLSLLAVETLLAGVPLVACRAPGLSEVLEDGYPFACPVEEVACLAERLAAVIDAPAASRQQVQGYVTAARQRFGVANMAARYRSVYQECMEASAQRLP